MRLSTCETLIACIVEALFHDRDKQVDQDDEDEEHVHGHQENAQLW